MAWYETGLVNHLTSYAGHMWNNITGRNQQQKQEQKFSAAEAEKQRNWEEQMSSTAYQRGTEDMIKSGLNPAMMYSNGANPASTPGGASATGSAVGGGGDPFSSLINSAANLAHSFNNDKNHKNDVTIKETTKAVKYLNESFFSDLGN